MKFSSTRNDRKRSHDHDAADQHQPLLDKPSQERYEKIRQSTPFMLLLICPAIILGLRGRFCFDLHPIFSLTVLWKTVNMLHNVHGVVMGSTPRETDVKRT
ncbi:hypothetical protein DVH24_011993 [Malus domestica]|uniref:Uncharacterized protein n=1 Tax=Malus domestica TaxID=3750 RepID=A0A498JAX9_MALDO|nr:hypothetical protein DVH24_011993 [Malus domestica]